MTPEPLRSRSSLVVALALMKLVKKINGLSEEPLTTERIAGLAEAETTGEQVRLADGESSPFGGYSPGSQKARVAEEMAEDAVAATDVLRSASGRSWVRSCRGAASREDFLVWASVQE